VLGIRPEDLYLVSEAGDEFPGDLEATVEVTEPLGDSLLLECRVGSDLIKVHSKPRRSIKSGDVVELAYDPERLHVFDEETGDTLYHSAPERTADQSRRRDFEG